MTGPLLLWEAFGATHPGAVRPDNEDAFLDRHDACLWAVADGMGGHDAGEVASAMIVDRLRGLPLPVGPVEAMGKIVARVLLEVNETLLSVAGEHRTIGSAVLVLVASGQRIAWLWAGDSRLYRMRHGRLEALTRDHRYVTELVTRGLLDSACQGGHSWSHVLTRAVGVDDTLELDIGIDAVVPGDTFLLCSDGLTDVVADPEIATCLTEGVPRDLVRRLIGLALHRQASDNITAVVVCAVQEGVITGGFSR